jgi:arylsulfatase A-like enzyme
MMKRSNINAAATIGACLFIIPGSAFPAEAPALAGKRPNVILIITDDQGYGDLGRHGNPVIKTPNLDTLFDESARFTDFTVSPTCAPTRAALMTGRHEFRSGVTHTVHERERLSLKSTTIVQALQGAGYRTGIFGKWHLGDEEAYRPNRRGFDEFFIHGAGGIGQSYPGSCGDAPGNSYFDPVILHNRKFEKTNGYCTDIFFARATKWIESVKGGQPFYCHIATNAPHAPLHCPEKYAAMYRDQPPDVAKFFGMITNIDDNVGRLLARLKEWGIENDTLVVFMNDNGGTVGVKVFNAGMRANKGTPYRGGTRGMAFFRWPGTIKPGDVSATAAHIDLYPTLASLAGIKSTEDAKLDGRSLLPLLENTSAAWPDRWLFTHVGRWPFGKASESKYAGCAVRHGDYHLVSPSPSPRDAPTQGPKWELYDLKNDPGERTNLTAAKPDAVRDMASAFDRWWDEVLPCLENEDAHKSAPKENSFKTLFRRQFGEERIHKTSVAIDGDAFHINGEPTYKGRVWNGKKIEGLLMNSRMVQGIFDDLNPETRGQFVYPDTKRWNPERNTREFIAAMPAWRKHGLLAFTLNLQGGSPYGYSRQAFEGKKPKPGEEGVNVLNRQPWHNSAFAETGALRPEYLERLTKILDAADDLGMVVILGYFYFGQDERLKDEAAVLRATDAATDWLLAKGYRNVVVEINNECDINYDHAVLQAPRVHELVERAKSRNRNGRRLLVGTSFRGGAIPTAAVVKASDFLLLHGNGVGEPARLADMIRRTRKIDGYRPMPIVVNEDDHFDFDKPANNFTAAVGEYASWGYFDYRMRGERFEDGFQSVPVDWSINSPRKRGFFKLLSEITGMRP